MAYTDKYTITQDAYPNGGTLVLDGAIKSPVPFGDYNGSWWMAPATDAATGAEVTLIWLGADEPDWPAEPDVVLPR